MVDEERIEQIKVHWLPIDEACLLLGFCKSMYKTFLDEIREGLIIHKSRRPYKELSFYPQICAYFPSIYSYFVLIKDIFISEVSFLTKDRMEKIFREICETRHAFAHPRGDGNYQSVIEERAVEGTDFYVVIGRRGKSSPFKRRILSYRQNGEYICIKDDLELLEEFYSILYQEKNGKKPSYKYKFKKLLE